MAIPTNPCCPVLSDDLSEQKPLSLPWPPGFVVLPWDLIPCQDPLSRGTSLFPVTQTLAQIIRGGLARWAGAEGLQG